MKETKTYKPKIRMLKEYLILTPLLIITLAIYPHLLGEILLIPLLDGLMFLAPYLSIVPVFFVFHFVYKILYVQKLKYKINEAGNLIKTRGVLGTFRQDIPFQRITNIHKNRNWLDKILGLTDVDIQTAGSDKIEMSFDGLSYEDGEEIYDILMKFKGQGDGT